MEPVSLWGSDECPVRPEEQTWIERELDWFVAQFGSDRLHGPVVEPTDDYFPGAYQGNRHDVVAVLHKISAHMGVDDSRLQLVYSEDEAEADDDHGLAGVVPLQTRWSGAAGHYTVRDGRSVVTIRDGLGAAPTALVATIAHELGHVLLLGDGRISPEREDGEPLTDLLTVFFGLGIFNANAAFDYQQQRVGMRHARWSTSRLGYLTEPMFGYALARYAWLRGEPHPTWEKYLDTNPREFCRRGRRYLASRRPAPGPI
jgi:hypothetical protein